MTGTQGKKIVLAARPNGKPLPSDFRLKILMYRNQVLESF